MVLRNLNIHPDSVRIFMISFSGGYRGKIDI